MSLFVVDSLTRTGRVFDLCGFEWRSGELPADLGLFEASDVTRFAGDHPGAVDPTVLPVRPPLDALWVESVFSRFGLKAERDADGCWLHEETGEQMLTYDRFGALVTCGEADDNGHRWVHIDGYGLCSLPPPKASNPICAAGTVQRLPFEGGYEIDDRGMLVVRDGGVSVAIRLRPLFPEPEPDARFADTRRLADEERAELRGEALATLAADHPVDAETSDELKAKARELLAHLDRIDEIEADTRRYVNDAAESEKVLAGLFDDGWRPLFESMAADVIAAVAAMNVRNTVREPVRVSRQVRRDRERRGLPDAGDVTVLKVPGAQRAAAGTGAAGEGDERAHHAVLGHFAYYGDTHPDGVPRGLLFGRKEGVFWHPPHWRGNREEGEKRHTYRVIPPA